MKIGSTLYLFVILAVLVWGKVKIEELNDGNKAGSNAEKRAMGNAAIDIPAIKRVKRENSRYSIYEIYNIIEKARIKMIAEKKKKQGRGLMNSLARDNGLAGKGHQISKRSVEEAPLSLDEEMSNTQDSQIPLQLSKELYKRRRNALYSPPEAYKVSSIFDAPEI
ncbi:uncharacterized protein LOC128249547 [Octopus bimaculoides]|nr:uncharacterized protein LOC128249547 [Octopus bimaculoides]